MSILNSINLTEALAKDRLGFYAICHFPQSNISRTNMLALPFGDTSGDLLYLSCPQTSFNRPQRDAFERFSKEEENQQLRVI